MRVLICLIVLLALPGYASGWWGDKWANRMPISITLPKAVDGASVTPETNVVLIKLHAGNFPDFFLLQESLADLRFMGSDEKTPLKFHVDSFDLTNQLLFVWVQVPAGQGDKAPIWMYYGNSEAVQAAEPAATYDVNQAAVFHFHNTPPSAADVTAYNTNATLTGGEIISASLIGAGVKLNGDGQFLVQDTPTLKAENANGFSVSFWLKPSAFEGKTESLISRNDAKGNSVDLFIDAANVNVQLVSQGKTVQLKAAKALDATKWQHIAVTLDQNKMHLYINAEEVKAESIGTYDLSGAINVGGKSTMGAGFKGEIDEIHFAKTALSASAISVMVKNQGMVDEVVSTNAPEEKGSGKESNGLFDVILKSTDTLGWILMGLMGVMAFITWVVMFGKALYIRQVQKDNTAFMRNYEKLVMHDPAELDKPSDEEDAAAVESPMVQAIFGKHDHYQSSTLYHLYHRGISEVKARSKTIQDGGLTTRANNAIRATLDAQLIREAQRLNSKMILLTIAISGGPFIGLFGTVMGVMITFAAIAKTGDVNIAAIAPGVAAALLTTLGGLFVAIPALFGYNYLSSRIKESIADMRVFGDEFTTRLAEYYGRS